MKDTEQLPKDPIYNISQTFLLISIKITGFEGTLKNNNLDLII